MSKRATDWTRHQAWMDGDDAGRSGRSSSACAYQRGTIYHDDWTDGFEHGQRALLTARTGDRA